MPRPITAKDVEILFSADEIAARIADLAREITATIGTDFVIVAILNGACLFIADLLRALHRAGATIEVDFIALSSYGDQQFSRGMVEIRGDVPVAVQGRTVLIVDDILETGRTLALARDLILARGAARVATCVLLDKPVERASARQADFVGFTCPDKFVVGYGMDVARRLRELPFIGFVRDVDGKDDI